MKSLWKDFEAKRFPDKLGLLVYSSRLLGAEPKLCVWGGGNTSTKVVRKDHLGRVRRVLHIKGSGSDLKVSQRKDYPPVDLEELQAAFHKAKMSDEEMVDYVSRCLLEPKAPRPSIEVLLHAFIDQPDIHHTHADAILSVTNTQNGKKIAQKIFGKELLWVPYVKPGFTLAKWVGAAYQKDPNAKGVILEKHGLITWGKNAKESYLLTIEMVSRAERYLARASKKRKFWSPQVTRTWPAKKREEWLSHFLPVIRQGVSQNQKALLRHISTPEVMAFVNAKDAPLVSQAGPATPDHMLRTKRVPLFVKGDPEQLRAGSLLRQIQGYARAHERYFKKHKKYLPKQQAAQMLDPYPKVVLVPGIGMIATGKDIKSADMVAEIYEHSISVMTNASSIDRYRSLSEKLAFEMDYWPMELYKLSLAGPEPDLSRQIGFVTGAARGIGAAIAKKLAEEGAHVFMADINLKTLAEQAAKINAGLKVGRVYALPMDVTNPQNVKACFKRIVLDCGGLDFVVSNAGIAHVSPIDDMSLKDWEKSFDVNATGHFLVAREAIAILKRQMLGGALVFITSKNVLAPGKDFGAYSTSKAAQAQLARILAIESGEFGIRVNMVNPDGIFEGSGLWDRIRANRARTYGIAPKALENYYQQRNLMKTPIYPEDVAESVAFLISKRSAKTTGCILTVDGGVKAAFPR